MSRNLHVVALDLERLRAVADGGDERWLAELLERSADRLVRHDAHFREFPGITTYTPLADTVAQIVRGRIDSSLSPRFQLEHAAALIADSLGEPLEADLFNGSDSALWEDAAAVIRTALIRAGERDSAWPSLDHILKRGPYIELPIDPVWPLGSGYLDPQEVRDAARAAEACDLEVAEELRDELCWPDDAAAAAEQYRGWLRHAALQGLGLYFHA